MALYLKLLGFLKPYKGRFVAAFVCMILFSLFNLLSLSTIVPFLGRVLIAGQQTTVTAESGKVKGKIDKGRKIARAGIVGKVEQAKERARKKIVAFLDKYSRKQLLIIIVIALLVFTFFRGLSSFGREYLMDYVGQGVVKDLRLALYEKLQFLSLDYFSKRRTGTIISRLTNDVGFIERAVAGALRSLLQQSLSVIIFIGALFIFIPWKLSLLSLIVVPVRRLLK